MRPGAVLRLILLGGFAALLAGSSLAQTPLDEPLDEHSAKRLDRIEKAVKELRAIVFQGRETGQAVVVQPADTEGQMQALTDRLNDLDHTLTRMTGENEILRHDLDDARRETERLHTATDALTARVAALEAQVKALTPPPAPVAPPPEAQAAPPPPPATPATAFAAALAAMQAGDAPTAETEFREFVDQNGDGPRGPEARYYLGRLLLARGAWPDAATAEIGAIRGWPRTAWAPSAVLTLARALIGMQKTDDACQTLGELARRYPKAPAQVLDGAAEARRQAKCA